MRDINRVDIILDKLKTLWKNNSDFRFNQLLYWINQFIEYDKFYIEDDIFESLIDEKLEQKDNKKVFELRYVTGFGTDSKHDQFCEEFNTRDEAEKAMELRKINCKKHFPYSYSNFRYYIKEVE